MKKLLAACVVLALAVGLWLMRSHGSSHAANAPATSAHGVATPTGDPPLVKKLAGSDARREAEQRIAAAIEARSSSAASAPPSPHSAPAAPKLPHTTGGIESLPPDVFEALKAAIPYLEKCYGPGPPRSPIVLMTVEGDTQGTLIDPGQMTDEHGEPIDAALADCMSTALKSLELPPMVEGTSVQLQYTFRLH